MSKIKITKEDYSQLSNILDKHIGEILDETLKNNITNEIREYLTHLFCCKKIDKIPYINCIICLEERNLTVEFTPEFEFKKEDERLMSRIYPFFDMYDYKKTDYNFRLNNEEGEKMFVGKTILKSDLTLDVSRWNELKDKLNNAGLLTTTLISNVIKKYFITLKDNKAIMEVPTVSTTMVNNEFFINFSYNIIIKDGIKSFDLSELIQNEVNTPKKVEQSIWDIAFENDKNMKTKLNGTKFVQSRGIWDNLSDSHKDISMSYIPDLKIGNSSIEEIIDNIKNTELTKRQQLNIAKLLIYKAFPNLKKEFKKLTMLEKTQKELEKIYKYDDENDNGFMNIIYDELIDIDNNVTNMLKEVLK